MCVCVCLDMVGGLLLGGYACARSVEDVGVVVCACVGESHHCLNHTQITLTGHGREAHGVEEDVLPLGPAEVHARDLEVNEQAV